MFKHPFSFKGRIRRLEYGLSVLISYVMEFALLLIFSPEEQNSSIVMPLIFLLVFIPFCWFIIAQGVKRCHDRGNSGWYILIPLYSLWLLFADGEYGENRFGPNPKGRGNVDEIDQIGGYLQGDQPAAV